MFKRMLIRIFLILGGVSSGIALEPIMSNKAELVFEHSFANKLSKGWRAQFGEWKAVDGVLRARQIPADNHAAAARQILEMKDGVFQMRFRLVEKGGAFHFGFDPKRGSLKKKGHLFSVIVTPKLAKITKHIDKAKPNADPNEDLAKVAHQFEAEKWHTLLLEKVGTKVAAQIKLDDGGKTLVMKASHPTFHVPTPTLVFRCVGDGVEIDDINVWQTK